MTKAPLVTVYIPCNNYGRFLGAALESVADQLYTNWELFIIDEGSQDDTIEVARSFQRKVRNHVQVIQNESAHGLQKVANEVLVLAKGIYILRLDADDWLDESALLQMVAKLESNAGLGIVYGNFYYTNEEGVVIGQERRRKLGKEDSSYHLPPHGACTMFKTNILKSLGGYSEDIDAQDGWELWFKLLQRTNAASLDSALFYYRQHGQSLSRDSSRMLKARSEIFEKIRKQNAGDYQLRCLAVIPVKESYPNFEGAPFRKINDKTLLEIAIHGAQNSNCITEVYISSESDNVFRFLTDLTTNNLIEPISFVRRPPEVSSLMIRPTEILHHAAEAYHSANGCYPDIVLFLSVHSPFRTPQHIDSAVNVLLVQCCDSVVSVCEEREPVFIHADQGLKLFNPGRFEGLTYEREKLFRFNGSIIATWMANLNENDLFGQKIGYLEMAGDESGQIKASKSLPTF